MYGKCTSLFQYAESLTEKLLLIGACYVMINIVACYCIEVFIGIIQLAGIPLIEFGIVNAFCIGVILAELLAEGSILLAPAVYACHSSLRISLCAGNSQRTAAAAHIKSPAALGKSYILRSSLNYFLRELTLAAVGKFSVCVGTPCQHCSAGKCTCSDSSCDHSLCFRSKSCTHQHSRCCSEKSCSC